VASMDERMVLLDSAIDQYKVHSPPSVAQV
jgi:hypothetical protein